MNFIFVPSLEHIALIKTAITLFNQDDIRALMSRMFCFSERKKKWQEVEDKVIEKVPDFPLPESLKKKVLGFIKPIGLEILKWISCCESFLLEKRFVRGNLNKLCWTPQGTIDKKKSAEALIKDEGLHITSRYKLACNCCLESDIKMLWNKIPEDWRKFFYEEDPSDIKQQELVVFWTYYFKGEIAKLDNMIEGRWRKCTPYQYAFEYAAVNGNKTATEHFLQKLTPKEREESLLKTAGYVTLRGFSSASSRTRDYYLLTIYPKEYYADVLCFLLSQMNEEQQVKVFKNSPYNSRLRCFLNWPWQEFFMKTVKCMWAFLPEEVYDFLLLAIVDKVIDGYKDYNYQNLFREFWQQSPITHKEYVIDDCESLLSKLLQVKDKESIKLILEDATTQKREKVIFSDEGKRICESLICNNQRDLLKFFIQECISSKDMAIKFKKEFKERIIRSEETLEGEKDMWSEFFQLLDDLIQSCDKKRKMEEGNSSPTKRLCSLTSEQF